MVKIQSILVGFGSGILFSISWIFFLDGQINSHDSFIGTHILPPLFASVAAIAINLVTVKQVSEHILAKLWLFLWITVQCICIGASIFILSTEYPIDTVQTVYPGLSLLLQTVLCMMASFIFFAGKSKIDSSTM